MGYIIAGANLANAEMPSINLQADTAADALTRIEELERGGYRVRISSSEGDEITVAAIKARVVLEQEH
ncbi:hypothetical protein ACRAWG_16495 [Methylobacterium sp. P31]